MCVSQQQQRQPTIKLSISPPVVPISWPQSFPTQGVVTLCLSYYYYNHYSTLICLQLTMHSMQYSSIESTVKYNRVCLFSDKE